GGDQFGVFGLELLELVKKLVEVVIGNLRPRLDVVEVVMVIDLSAQLLDSRRGVLHGPPGMGDWILLQAFCPPRGPFASGVAAGNRPTCSRCPVRSRRRPRRAATSSR